MRSCEADGEENVTWLMYVCTSDDDGDDGDDDDDDDDGMTGA